MTRQFDATVRVKHEHAATLAKAQLGPVLPGNRKAAANRYSHRQGLAPARYACRLAAGETTSRISHRLKLAGRSG